MSSAEATTAPGTRRWLTPAAQARAFHWLTSAVSITIIAAMTVSHWDVVSRDAPNLLPWVVLLAVVNLLPVPVWQATTLAADLPIATAAGLVLQPVEMAIVSLLGVVDLREFRREITPSKAVFNRCQIALTNLAGSVVVHRIVSTPGTSSLVLPLAFLYLSVTTGGNYVLVGVAVRLEKRVRFSEVVRRLRVGAPFDFWLTFAAWAVLGAMLASFYDQVPPWTLLVFLAPILVSRQTLVRSQMHLQTLRAYEAREKALRQLTERIHEERTDERHLIAADLHDEVLQPLYKVNLMAHVLKADLATGRLLEIDEDLPELLAAAEVASGILRELIGDLRRSALGPHGLSKALVTLCRELGAQSAPRIHSHVEEVDLPTDVQLAVYQIAKEALINAISHSNATSIWVELRAVDGATALVIRDDGSGFDPYVPKEGHFGLHIMRERAASIGAALYFDSSIGSGTRVTVTVPTRNSPSRTS